MSHPLENAFLSADLPNQKLVVICQFRDDVGPVVPQNPAVYFQVTLDPNKVSHSKRFIRFGDTQGDEIVGWQRREYIRVVEVLGELTAGGVVPLEDGPLIKWYPLAEKYHFQDVAK